jgi:hypothetical protein
MESYLLAVSPDVSGVSRENSCALLLKCDHLAGIKRVFSPWKMLESVRHGFRFAYDKRSKKGGTCANPISAGEGDFVEDVV